MSDDENTGDHILGGMGIPLPQELLAAMNREHDKVHMEIDAEKAREERFLDSLDADGLLALDYMLTCNPERAFANNTYYRGQINTLLRVVHKVDNQGKPLDQIPED